MIKPQLALHLYKELEKKRTTVQDDTFLIFEKYDGWYGVKDVSLAPEISDLIMSRRLRKIPSLLDLSRSMRSFEQANHIDLTGTLIFEILIDGVPVFKDLNGILNRSKAPCQAKGAYIMVHDFIPTGLQQDTMARYRMAKAYVEKLAHPQVRLAPIQDIGTIEAVQRVAEAIWEKGGEGSIGKREYQGYSEGKRNKDIVKVKMEVTLEGIVVGVLEGKGKYVGTTGTIQVRMKDGTVHEVSGMSDAERDLWYDTPNLIKGQVVELQAMQVLANGSLREGRFKAVRHDKDVSEID